MVENKFSFEDTFIARALTNINDGIDDLEFPALRGFLNILTLLILIGIIFWLVFNFIKGHWGRSTILLGIWLFAELCNRIGWNSDE